jgi:hypothetical protein
MNIIRKQLLKDNVILGIFSDCIVIYDRNRQYVYCTTNFKDYLWESYNLKGSVSSITEDMLLFHADEICKTVNKKTGSILSQFNVCYRGNMKELVIATNTTNNVTISMLTNCIQKKTIWEGNYIISNINLLYGSFLVCLFFSNKYRLLKDNLICIDFMKGSFLWQFSIKDFPNYINGFGREQEADIKQIIGVYNNILWIHVGGFRLVGIDIETGKKMHYIENVLKAVGNNFLDEIDGMLKTLSYDYYAEFDLETLKFRKQIQINCPEDIKIRSTNFYLNDKHLYFCGYYRKSDKPNVFGIFDTEKAEIVWYDTQKDDLGYFYNPPQANDKLLVILDDKHNLLVYDKE